jgi:transcriptional regulator with XRE-family HTH domain
MKIDNVLVGKAIARLREERDLTQSQLNDLVGMSTIQHIEQGRNAVSLTCLNKIASALDIPAACIVLLGSKIDEGDRVLSSLHSLLEKTLRLEVDEKGKSKAKGKKATARASKGRKRKVATQKKQKPKRQTPATI